MTTLFIDKSGKEFIPTTVLIPRELHEDVRKAKIPLSHTLKLALEKELAKRNAGAISASNTDAPTHLSSTDKQVDE